MNLVLAFTLLLGSAFAQAFYKAEFPQGPLEELTPGSLCSRPSSYRYEEHIPYCNRNVDSHLKADVISEYRHEGYRLNNRKDYKIDHLIPLCAGGSNREDNLWPQHRSIYVITDPLESVGCEKLKEGKIKQAALVKLIIEAKRNISIAPKTLNYLKNL
jgi:hypothetical protein